MSIQNSSCDTNKLLIICYQRHDLNFQLNMHHKAFGGRILWILPAVPGHAEIVHSAPQDQ